MIKEISIIFSILLLLFLFFGISLAFLSIVRKRPEINYLSFSYILRAIGYIGPAILIYNLNIEFSVWLTGPIKVFVIPLNYLFVRKLFDEDKSWQRTDIWHFVPFILDCILTFPIAYFHADDVVNGSHIDFNEAFKTVWEGNFYFTLLSTVGRGISFLQWTYYFIISIPLVRKCIYSLRMEKSNINPKYIIWLRGITFLFIFMGLFEGSAIFGIYSYPPFFLSHFFFLIFYAFYFFFFVVLFVGETNLKIHTPIVEDQDFEVKENEIEEWLQIFIERQCFLDSDLTLQKVSEELNLPKYKLTLYIRNLGYSSFYSFVNYYRVEKGKELLEKLPPSHVVESIADACGFSSRSTFFRVFKEFTGTTPGKYLLQNCNQPKIS